MSRDPYDPQQHQIHVLEGLEAQLRRIADSMERSEELSKAAVASNSQEMDAYMALLASMRSPSKEGKQ